MEKFFKPKSIAVVGASPIEGKVGNIILKNLVDYGFEGELYPINPKHQEINGIKTYATVLDIKEEVDLAIIAIPANFIPQIIKECAEKRDPISNIIIISAGFSESGEEGRILENEISQIAKKNKLNILGPNCLGTVNTFFNLNASFAKTKIKKGTTALIMQSGAFATAFFDLVWGENFGFSKVATLGNKMTLNEADFLEYFLEDEESEVVALYLESISDGKRFKEVLEKVSKKKPVLILKAGNSEKVKSAIMSHTGSMAGESDVVRRVVEESGGIYFENARELFSAIKYFESFSLPNSNEIIILSNAGGPGVIATDLIEGNENLKMAEIDESQKEALKKVLPKAASVDNPIDILGDAQEDRYDIALSIIKDFKNVGAVLGIITPQAQTDVEKISQIFVKANKDFSFPIIPLVMGYEANKIAQKVFEESGISNFIFPSDAVRAIELACFYKKQLNKNNIKEEVISMNEKRSKLSREIFEKALSDGERNVFYYEEALKLVDLYDFKAVPFYDAMAKNCLEEIEYPIVAKIDSPKLLHKNSKNGLELGISNKEIAQKAIVRLQNDFPSEKIILQSQVESGLEVIFGIKKDPNFGSVFMCGLGGILTEIFNEKMIWFLPVSAEKIARDLKNSKIGKVLEKQRIDVDRVAKEAEKIALLGFENEWIKELDVNPIIFYKDKNPISVDVKVIGEERSS